jgi:hypothetical protein
MAEATQQKIAEIEAEVRARTQAYISASCHSQTAATPVTSAGSSASIMPECDLLERG